MSRRSSWRWTRWIARAEEPLWLQRLEARGETNWLVIDKPGRARLAITIYSQTRRQAEILVPIWGGRVERAPETRRQKPGPPLQVGPGLEIVHETPRCSPRGHRLYIPYGMAFGSGEHATTLMLLRALARRSDGPETTLLDLGTGSGVLALAARKLGARKIVAIDFDRDAIRTARQNELLNFPSHLVRWKCADVKQLSSLGCYSLIVANLFSGILCAAALPMARALRPDGELWLSGILRAQQDEVAVAYRAVGLQLLKTTTRGKWVMQRWTK